ncbi:hypothetical protein [Acaryochloris sp. CCMEE 5410]|uniref:hypothetical protein n=1 Tax=Acaryochloris sp. CCMEE 5410 TaxID=310037 RepID=UPI0002484B2A|nr:hypothetical protein [Acaryochloris sp. CCMEE 5410]KAI9129014.1 hypothetical protein ON05_037255 [Acaryochloris sp. CCMEE 5410]
MTNKLAEQLNLDAKKLSHLLAACGMTEELHDIEALKAVIAMRDSGEVTSNRQGYCLYLAQQHGVNAEEIHKAIEPTKIKTSDKDYLPLYINVCIRVAGGEAAVQAVESELSQSQSMEQGIEAIPLEIRELLDEKTTATIKATVLSSFQRLEGLQSQVESYVDHRIKVSMDSIMEDPDVKAAAKRLIEGTTPEKSPILEASLVE